MQLITFPHGFYSFLDFARIYAYITSASTGGVVIGRSLQEVAEVTGVPGIKVGVDLSVREVDGVTCVAVRVPHRDMAGVPVEAEEGVTDLCLVLCRSFNLQSKVKRQSPVNFGSMELIRRLTLPLTAYIKKSLR